MWPEGLLQVADEKNKAAAQATASRKQGNLT